ncbi:unnamed protein product [Caenorhabditis auriculariae]|uniref:Uncharacterized protein n=1 Tax=Caenorhabditis auriculariae TaxID=2777116 RepID=A0A8S1H9R7_9PELO|nr:unnamed protein product [Caenorhabditis auriculariae]
MKNLQLLLRLLFLSGAVATEMSLASTSSEACEQIIIISFHHVDWSVSLPLSHGIIFRRPSALDKLGSVLFHYGEAVHSLVLPAVPHCFPTLAVTPGRIGQRLWTVTRADD